MKGFLIENLFFFFLKRKKIWFRFFRTRPILHRDLKSRNVFLKNNQIKLGDMGVSRVLAESFANTFLGTPFYMSPEMIKDSKYDCKEKFYMNRIITKNKTFIKIWARCQKIRFSWHFRTPLFLTLWKSRSNSTASQLLRHFGILKHCLKNDDIIFLSQFFCHDFGPVRFFKNVLDNRNGWKLVRRS